MIYRIFLVLTSILIANCDTQEDRKHGCPGFCQCYIWNDLKRADCNRKNLYSIHNDISTRVQVIDFSYNVISVLENDAFQDMKQTEIQELKLEHNQIHDVQPRSFYGLKKLRVLDLSSNHIRYIAPDTFKDNVNLKELNLAENVLGESIGQLHLNIPSLQVLDISNCRIPFIPGNFFHDIPKTKELYLTDNTLQGVEVETMKPLYNLKSIDLTGNIHIICDSKTKQLLEWLEERNIYHNTFCTQLISVKNSKEKKMEKMISLDEPINPLSEFEENGWSEQEEEEEEEEVVEEVDFVNKNETKSLMNDFISKMIESAETISGFIAASVGYFLGIISGLGLAYCYVRIKRNRGVTFRRRRPGSVIRRPTFSSSIISRTNDVYTWSRLNTPPGTPPPPYRFSNIHLNNV